MRIGILAYHAAYNFGANLQVLSTYEFFKNKGYEPIVLHWIAEDLELVYDNSVSIKQASIHKKYLKENFVLTKLCRNEIDIARSIESEQIEAVLIGSDAVAQHHPLLGRIVFPSRRIFSVERCTSDRMFPNPFWGTFLDHLGKRIPLAVMSASCQNSSYKYIGPSIRNKMSKTISQYSYLSARDEWTQNMYKYISNGNIVPKITPDPVFAFNLNVGAKQLSKEYIINKFSLPEKYILLSFLNSRAVSNTWLYNFEDLANEQGFACVALPFPKGILFNNNLKKSINIPLSPLEWYALIKYSSGYIGHNMHPLIVSLSNSVPIFSFDNYGVVKFRLFTNKKSSKIYHILKEFNLLDNRVTSNNFFYKEPSPEFVFEKLQSFNKENVSQISQRYLKNYLSMMSDITNVLENNL